MTRILLALLLVGTVSGCLNLTRETRDNALLTSGFDTMPEKYCTTDNSPATKADWNKATVIEETITDSRYESGLITLWHEKPYIIRVTNNDAGDRSFRAPLFFRDIAILKAVYNNKPVDAPCINAVALAPGAVAELHVVPLKKGDYDYHETGLWVPFGGEIFSTADVGLIYVH
ncbi:MAG: hypothetical protein HOH04_04725 [Rhodospirillaceae bacterium]|nr:hypothetical protein [Rhodospirillaceae bacterium]